jgi:hypothetical protein
MSAAGRDDLHHSMQHVCDRASEAGQTRYLELMRHDPVAGMAYLEALAIKEGETD